MSNDLTIYQRIAQAYKEISAQAFEKTGTVTGAGGGYRFIPIGQILEVVRRAQSNAGVVVVFGRPMYDASQGEARTSYEKTSTTPYGDKRTTTWYHAVGHIDVRIYGASDDDCIEVSVPFEAQDNSDKLTNKIVTNAERCLYRTLYTIDEGGEDPEAVNEPNEAPAPAPAPAPKKAREAPKDDPFFAKPDTAKPASDDISDAELANIINVRGRADCCKEAVKAFKLAHDAKTAYDLDHAEKLELYHIIQDLEGSE